MTGLDGGLPDQVPAEVLFILFHGHHGRAGLEIFGKLLCLFQGRSRCDDRSVLTDNPVLAVCFVVHNVSAIDFFHFAEIDLLYVIHDFRLLIMI